MPPSQELAEGTRNSPRASMPWWLFAMRMGVRANRAPAPSAQTPAVPVGPTRTLSLPSIQPALSEPMWRTSVSPPARGIRYRNHGALSTDVNSPL